jgi:spore germination protein YaaH
MKQIFFSYIIFFALLFATHQLLSKLSIMGAWLPYWRSDQAIDSAREHISHFNQLSPFSYEVKDNGSLVDPFRRNKARWDNFFEYARSCSIKLIPTIFWTNTGAMHTMLSQADNRDRHINQIVQKVVDDQMHGININYERVPTQDREHFLEFIKTLSERLHAHGCLLCCSVGGRVADNCLSVFRDTTRRARTQKTPPSVSLNPGDRISAEKYKRTLATYCDQIHVMGYDEWGMPFLHSPEYLKTGYYVSHASDQWIEAIIQYALTYIPAHKLVLGIGTYGLEFTIYPHRSPICFKKVRNVTYPRALELSSTHAKIPQRTGGGELAFTYTHEQSLRYVCFLDAQAIKNKLVLARKYNLSGMYLFKVDGQEDPAMWRALEEAQALPCTRPFTVVVDPGHSGIYAETVGTPSHTFEKNINLAFAQELAEQLSKHAISVILTRSERNNFNTYLHKDMPARSAIARNCKADLFFSIYCSQQNAHTAHHYILGSGTMPLFCNAAYRLTRALAHALGRTAQLPQRSRHVCIISGQGVKQARLYALCAGSLPTVLLELYCTSGTGSTESLLSATYRAKLCKLITQGILEYRNNRG